MGRIFKFFAWILALLSVGAISGFLGVLAVVYSMVYFGDDSALKRSTIMARINEETNIYMLDEQTQIGSIFADAHRRYVPIDEVPKHLLNALIAAEDKNFYNHHGIDPAAIVAAVAQYAKGGRMRGASTLTQQTVRNILGWWDPTLSRKFREWIAALQLEKHYSKSEILEFYLNQFHVSGNGRGVGIAAKYYFNKEVRDLDLVESAFIAGSVKGPSQYDPFIKYTREKRQIAINRAFTRKNYVLKRMYEQKWISQADFKTAWEQPVKFNRGEFRSDEVALVQLIRSELEKKEVLDALGLDDPRELSGAGLKIYTTIDGELQKAAQLAVRRNLARLDTILKGFKPEKPEFFRSRRTLEVNEFYFGKVDSIRGTEKEPEIILSFGDINSCTIPFDSLMRYAKLVDLPWYRGWEKELARLMKEIKPGDVLFTEVKEYNEEKHHGVCEMMKRPVVNGGLIALDKGEVRAVVSGFDTKGFNRSVHARRQPGSVFKPVVYFAALQLGWSILDRLDNERQIFPYQGRFYYPRPDHDSPYHDVSIMWAGVTSENLASVYLANRLLDKINFDQFKQLLNVMDLAPKAGELPRDYHYRVARALGVTLDNEGVREFQIQNAIDDLLLDIQMNTSQDFQSRLKKMWWGRGYASEMENIYSAKDDLSAAQKTIKINLASNNFTRMQALATQLAGEWQFISAMVAQKGADQAFVDPAFQKVIRHFRVLAGLSKPGLGFVMDLDGEKPAGGYRHQAEIDRLTQPQGRFLTPLDVQAIWGGNALFGSAGINLPDVQLDGWFPYAYQQSLAQYVDKNYAEAMSRTDEYDLPRYFQHHDFRIALGLNYLVNLAKAMGVTSEIEPVQSFPLGTNVVTLAEVAKIYQTFVSGKTYRYYKDGPPNQINFIRKIVDRHGNTLFEPKPTEYQLVPPELGLQMREQLARVVTHGTGRRARAELYMSLGEVGTPSEKKIRIPVYGKTGTTNDYNNANFAGFMPYPTTKGQPLDPENSYVLAAYTGYDLNKTMQNGAIKVSGAIGALPAWIGLAKEIIDKKKFKDFVDPLDLTMVQRQEWSVKKDSRAAVMAVDMARGVVVGGKSQDQESVGLSDSSKDGESAFNEYRVNVVQASIQMPTDSNGAPLRVFSPYKLDASFKVPQSVPPKAAGKPAANQNGPSSEGESDPDSRTYDAEGNRDSSGANSQSANSTPADTSAAAPKVNPSKPAINTTAVTQPSSPKPAGPKPISTQGKSSGSLPPVPSATKANSAVGDSMQAVGDEVGVTDGADGAGAANGTQTPPVNPLTPTDLFQGVDDSANGDGALPGGATDGAGGQETTW